jgi:hypothetical protein
MVCGLAWMGSSLLLCARKSKPEHHWGKSACLIQQGLESPTHLLLCSWQPSIIFLNLSFSVCKMELRALQRVARGFKVIYYLFVYL